MPELIVPPGPKTRLPRGLDHMAQMVIDPIKYTRAMGQMGDLSHFFAGRRHFYVINNADYVREILVNRPRDFVKGSSVEWLKLMVGNGLLTSEGDFWLRQRRLAQPAFHRKSISNYADIMVEFTTRLRDSWEAGAILDIGNQMQHLTLEIVAKCLFDYQSANDNQKLDDAINALSDWSVRILYPLPMAMLMEKLPTPYTRRSRKALAFLDETIFRVVAQRRESGEDKGDLLSMLLRARDEDGSSMTDQQLRDEIITLILAGFETTALTLTWAWYLLAQHPEVEAKLQAEVDTVLKGRDAKLEDLPRLPYTQAVFDEVLRLYPPAYLLTRETQAEQKLGGYTIPKLSTVIMSPYIIHRNPKYFADPEKFDPDRWTPEMRAKLHKFAYFPFGGGSRMCIGEPFAQMEGVLILATMVQKWQMRLVTGQPVGMRPLITLRAKRPIKVRLEARKVEANRELAGSTL